ncbi:phosphotransferase family protein [Streptomyces kebangsaanensis]|uniref:phosphotransferase family protein n=1 Tax=Streptomyces kebangsaanensis TaxID=864058 RepID=UPI00093EE46B|nr:phosphotransferase family protein [Streptomyces kebangsaanensis]
MTARAQHATPGSAYAEALAGVPPFSGLRITGAERPTATGFAGLTLFVTTEQPDGTERKFVVKAAPWDTRVYPEPRIAEQYELLRVLGRDTDVPVPAVHHCEPSARLLGGPFFVMDLIPGQVPSDFPSYHRQGWIAELPAEDRARLWWASMDAMSQVHRVDARRLGLGFVAPPDGGPPGTTQQLDYYERHMEFFGCAGDPVLSSALSWLRAHLPAEPGPPGLLWGDARLGNIVYGEDLRPAVLLDWEMTGLGPAEVDLGWFLWMDRFLSEGIGAGRLAGLPGHEETVQRYGELIGRPLAPLPYYEILAGFRFALVTSRVERIVLAARVMPPGVPLALHANAKAQLGRALARITGSS